MDTSNLENGDNTSFEKEVLSSVVKNIYYACDPGGTDSVPVIQLIEFVEPYMIEDLNALEVLKKALDPENKNVCVSSSQFYEVMSSWTKKVAHCSEVDAECNALPGPNEMGPPSTQPYYHSTPKPSFGEKLLKNKDLLNLSNVSTYSLSRLDQSNGDTEKTLLEDQIRTLRNQLAHMTNELTLTKLQLTASEEQSETLQADLERVNRRLRSEQSLIENLQKDKTYSEDLRDELDNLKAVVSELRKKGAQYEKDMIQLNNIIERTEAEKDDLYKKYNQTNEKYQEARKEILNMNSELQMKECEISTMYKNNEEYKNTLTQNKVLLNELRDENELLMQQKMTMEKTLKDITISASNQTCSSIISENYSLLALESDNESDACLKSLFDSGGGESLKSELFKADQHEYQKIERDLIEKVKALTEENESLTQHNHQLTQQLEQHQHKSLREQLIEKDKEIELLRNQSFRKHQEVEEFKQHLSDNNDQILTDLQTTMKHNIELETQVFDLKNDLYKSNLLCDTKTLEIQELTERYTKIIQELKDTKGKLKEIERELNLKATLLEEKQRNLVKICEKTLTEIEYPQLKQLIESLKLNNLEDNTFEILKQINKDFKIKSDKFALLQAKYDKVSQQLSDKILELFEVVRSKEGLEQTHKSDTNLIEQLERQLMQVHCDSDRLKSDFHEAQGKMLIMQNIEANYHELEAEVHSKTLQLMDIKDTLKREVEIKNDLWRSLKELEFKVNSLKDDNDELICKEKQLFDTYEVLQLEHKALQNNFENEVGARENLTLKVLELNTKIEQLTTNNATLEEEFKVLQQEFGVVSNELDLCKVSKEELKKELEQCMQKYEEAKKNITDDNEREQKSKSYCKLEQIIHKIKEKEEYLKDRLDSVTQKYDNIIKDNKDLVEKMDESELEIKRLKACNDNLNVSLSITNSKNEKIYSTLQDFVAKVLGSEEDSSRFDIDDLLKLLDDKIQNMNKEIMAKNDICIEKDDKYAKVLAENRKLQESVADLAKMLEHALIESRSELESANAGIYQQIHTEFEHTDNDKLVILISDYELLSKNLAKPGVEDQMHLLHCQIQITITLLNCLKKVMASEMKVTTESVPKNTANDTSSESKQLNKFTLRPPTLIVRRHADSPSEVDINGEFTFDQNGSELTHVEQTVICHEPFLLETNSPALNNKFLESLTKLGIEENVCPKKILNKNDLEPYFTALTVQISISIKDINERLADEKDHFIQKKDSFTTLLTNITTRLRDHVCYGTSEPIKPVFVLLEELKILCVEMNQIAAQMGLLSYEHHMRRPWSLVINYLALLRQENESLLNPQSRSESTHSQTQETGLRKRSKNSPTTETSNATKVENMPLPSRSRGLRSPILTFVVFLILTFLFGTILYTHWQCRSNAKSVQDCILDPFSIKKIIGPPPI